MQKLERLLNLTAVLLHSGRPLSAAELRARVPGYPDSDAAFHRSFERDKDDLREMGVPLELREIPGADPPLDGYLIPRDDYYLPDLGLEPEEVAALQLAASAVQLDGVEGIEALWKLGGVTDVGAVAARAAIPTDPRLAPVFDAVSRRAVITFSYNGERREVQPHGIVFRRGNWYLRGFDTGRDDRRTFRVDRIEGAVEAGPAGAFEPPTGDDDQVVADGWRLAIDPPVRARLLVDASHAAIAVGHLGDDADAIDTRPDGSAVIELTVTNRSAFRSMVLTYLEHAEILEPAELRADLVAWLRSVPGAVS